MEKIERIFVGKCELADYPDIQKVKIKNGYGDPMALTYESAMEMWAVLNRWRQLQEWNARNAKKEA